MFCHFCSCLPVLIFVVFLDYHPVQIFECLHNKLPLPTSSLVSMLLPEAWNNLESKSLCHSTKKEEELSNLIFTPQTISGIEVAPTSQNTSFSRHDCSYIFDKETTESIRKRVLFNVLNPSACCLMLKLHIMLSPFRPCSTRGRLLLDVSTPLNLETCTFIAKRLRHAPLPFLGLRTARSLPTEILGYL